MAEVGGEMSNPPIAFVSALELMSRGLALCRCVSKLLMYTLTHVSTAAVELLANKTTQQQWQKNHKNTKTVNERRPGRMLVSRGRLWLLQITSNDRRINRDPQLHLLE